jgi:hypothetical protein
LFSAIGTLTNKCSLVLSLKTRENSLLLKTVQHLTDLYPSEEHTKHYLCIPLHMSSALHYLCPVQHIWFHHPSLPCWSQVYPGFQVGCLVITAPIFIKFCMFFFILIKFCMFCYKAVSGCGAIITTAFVHPYLIVSYTTVIVTQS